MLHKVKELSAEQRVALESLLGRAISDRETVSVRAFEPDPLGEQGEATLAQLDAYFARIDAKQPPLSESDAEALITEALRSTRPHYRPIR